MKKKDKFFVIAIFISIGMLAQDWAWMKGSNLNNQMANYGIKNVASSTTNPGARGGALGWKSNSGELWLFGGEGNASTTFGKLNDLFKFDIISNNWTWVKGDTIADVSGVYGTKGVSSQNNKPGGRAYGGTWVDAAGNFWLFGGMGYDAFGTYGGLSDLWKYDVLTGNWTWISGSNIANQNGVYGNKGVGSSLNIPGARYAMGSWFDSMNNLWLLAGYGNGNSSFGTLNDLWKYNISSNQWTWVRGDSAVNSMGNFGTQGVSSPSNDPSAREIVSTMKDASGNFWFFGGFGPGAPLNDLWKYNPSTNQWTWVKGSSSPSQQGSYGTLNVSALSNCPGSRSINIGWKDNAGNFWIFGGYGLGSVSGPNNYLNDMWKYSPVINEWVWEKGPNTSGQPGNYGTQGVASAFNIPPARSNSTTWVDNNGDLWMFGSAQWGAYYTNDLWKLSNPIITSLTENTDKKFSIYPNPATEKLYIKSEVNIQKYILSDMNGRIIYESSNQQDQSSVDLTGFVSGIYTLKIISNENISIHRINIVK